jgi:ribonuclease III
MPLSFLKNIKPVFDFFKKWLQKEEEKPDLARLLLQIQEMTGTILQHSELFEQAFIHSSAINPDLETRNNSYERLEFLGDAVLELIVSEFLYKNFPDHSEGKLTQIRAQLVNQTTLANTSKELGFGDYLHLGKGAEKDNIRNLHSVLCDIYESFVGALYLENGYDAAWRFVHESLLVKHHTVIPSPETQNYKGLLYEYCQKRNSEDPDFVVTDEEGPDHNKEFTITVYIADQPYGSGVGKSKKEASQIAARKTLEMLDVSI